MGSDIKTCQEEVCNKMKTLSETKAESKQPAGPTEKPVKVCMHILMRGKNEVRAMRVGSALSEAGFTVSLIDVEPDPTLPAEETIAGVRLQHMIIPRWFTARRFPPLFFLVALKTFFTSIPRLFRSQADIYHAHELTSLPATYLVAKLRRKPLIFEAYELHLPRPETDVAFWRVLGAFFMRLLALLLPRCQGVIAASPRYAQELAQRYHLAEVVPLRNVPSYREVQKTDLLRQHLGLSQETRIVLYQGAIQRNRSLDIVIRAARFWGDNIVFVMMGQKMGTTGDELEALIASEGVGERVKIIPPVPYKDLLDWTSSADLGLTLFSPQYSLSIQLTQPNKLFEYLMAGLPVLSSQLDAIADVLETYDAGRVISSLAPADVAAAIETMLADREALQRMHQNALRAAKECCWEKDSQLLLKLYQRIARENGLAERLHLSEA
jgi:glycosyltransferase involved in cell wall biosynthesis